MGNRPRPAPCRQCADQIENPPLQRLVGHGWQADEVARRLRMDARRCLAPRAAAARAAVAHRRVNAPTLAVQDGFTGTPLSGAGEWDAYVAAHPDATPFHSRAWCEAITRATGHPCHLVTARDADGALTGILPLHHVRSPLFGRALVGSGFAVDGGILADERSEEHTSELQSLMRISYAVF